MSAEVAAFLDAAFAEAAREVVAEGGALDRLRAEIRAVAVAGGSIERLCVVAFEGGGWRWPAYDRWQEDFGLRYSDRPARDMGEMFAAMVVVGAKRRADRARIEQGASTCPFVQFLPVIDSLTYTDCAIRNGEVWRVGEIDQRRPVPPCGRIHCRCALAALTAAAAWKPSLKVRSQADDKAEAVMVVILSKSETS